MEKILNLTDFKTVFDQELFRFLDQKKQEVSRIDPKCTLLATEIERLVRSGGKRLRPYLCYLGFKLVRQTNNLIISNSKTLKFFFSLELLHAFALIHDDIMDEAGKRHNQPTTYSRFGRDVAILVGDLAFSWADDLFSETLSVCSRRSWATPLLSHQWNKLKTELVCGQYLDVQEAKNHKLKINSYKLLEGRVLKILRLKTGLYTIARPLQLGWLLGQSSHSRSARSVTRSRIERNPTILDRDLKTLEDFGTKVGIAFQVKDDLLDLYGQDRFGKPIGGDIREGKLTLWLVRLMRCLKKQSQKGYDQLLSLTGKKDLTTKELDQIKAWMAQHGIKDDMEQTIDTLLTQAKNSIINFSGQQPAIKQLLAIADFVGKRKY